MNHGRPDYNKRIVDLAGKIPPDEPVFFIRGHDPFGPVVLREYAATARAGGAPANVVQRVADQADAMEAYQRTHRPRMPD